MRRVVEAAASHGNEVWLDMEYSRYVDPTLDLYRAIRADHANLGICLQAYLHRTPADLESLIPVGPAIRLVRVRTRSLPMSLFPRSPRSTRLSLASVRGCWHRTPAEPA